MGRATWADIRVTDDIGWVLSEALTEARRLAKDAQTAERDRYQSGLGYIALAALFVWFLLFIGLGLVLTEPEFNQRLLVSLIVASTVAAGAAAPALWAVRRRLRPPVLAVMAWVDRLDAVTTGGPSKEPTMGSVFELLAEVSKEVPRWIEAERRAGLVRDPTTWGWVFFMVWIATNLLMSSLASDAGLGGWGVIAVGGTGLVLFGAAAFVYLRWRSRRDTRLLAERARWDRRFQEARASMERYLEEL